MRFAVTGAAGYVGGWLVKTFRARGHEVHGQDILPGADARFDLAHPESRQAWLDAVRPDVVVHLAALYGRIWGESDMVRTAGMNAGLTAALARDVAAAGSRLMFMSSSETYGATCANPGPILERMELRPLNCYGLSKKWGEEACQVYAPDGLAITRLNMPYGPAAVMPERGMVPEFSARAGTTGYNALHTWLWQAFHGMPLVVHANTKRCYTWVGDSCLGLAMIAESGKTGAFNVCRNDDHLSAQELAQRCVDLVPGCTSDIVVQEPDAGITRDKVLDSGRLWELGWRPEVSLGVGMKETLEYMARFDRQCRWTG